MCTTTTTSSASTCEFCHQPGLFAGKCAQHRYRIRCSHLHCVNQAYARNLCVQHGGKAQCQFQGCTGNVRRFGFCGKHSQEHRQLKLCLEDGCDKVAHSGQRCVKHGGGRQCKWSGCSQYSRHQGYCTTHFRQVQQHPLASCMTSDTDAVKTEVVDSIMSSEEMDMLLSCFVKSEVELIQPLATDAWPFGPMDVLDLLDNWNSSGPIVCEL
ncbi:Aste57867_1711 [Aphanomyces stellatus]|uniref:Aste57867_1711 protein n=1 Tax=Aphanomyces stellatus TaxID=120398 RepID=A0A485KB11_9STRA|nr:hypothetical protein As57867_001709 [Aphanomyces stellatus]VFT78922.1 Aste57867_1711 [Aphanomyces stellatus]